MSDGGDATPGRRRPAEPGEVNPWLTRSTRPTPGAAPWERGRDVEFDASTAPEDESEDTDPTGNHARGVNVADLIARISAGQEGPADKRIGRRRAAKRDAEAEQTQVLPPIAADPPRPDEPAGEPDVDPDVNPDPSGINPDLEDTDILPALAAYAGELPDLGEVPDLGETGALGGGADASRVPPSRVGSTRSAAPRRRARAGRRRAMFTGRAAVALIAASALVLTGGAWQWQTSKNSSLNRVAALDPDSRDILDPNAQFGDENFLIVGTDSRIGENSAVGAGDTDDAAGARSDTVMLVNIPANRERVVAVSFPRDLAITPMLCEPWNAETGAYGPIWDEESQSYGPDEVYTEYKLNSAYAFGGPKCLVKVIQKLSGLSVNRFMAVDFTGFANMVDAMGGVEVCTTKPLVDYELGTVLPRAGRQIVDGETALNYVRARQVTTEINGDYGRIKRQQLFLSSLLRSLISKEVFFSLSKLNNVVNMFIEDSHVDNIDTKDLVQLGQSIQGVTAGRITFVTVPTGETDEYGNEPPRTADMRALFDAIIDDDPLPGEKNADNTPVPGTPESTTATTRAPQSLSAATPDSGNETGETVDAVTTAPQNITVQVSNSTSEMGLAASAADVLQRHGFNVGTPNDYPTALSETTVRFAPGNERAAATVASAFANPTIERVSGMGNMVQVVLGSDFDAVNAPSPSGSPVQVQVIRGTKSAHPPLPDDLTVTNAADTTCD